MKEKLQKSIQKFKDLECISAIAGSGTGSIFTLEFSKNIIQKNDKSKEFPKQSLPEYAIMVYSSWSLCKGKNCICDSNSSNEKDGQMVVGLKRLIGNKIKSITLLEDTMDLEIEFESNFRILILSDGSELYGEDAEICIFFFPSFIMSITTSLEIKENERY